MKRQYLIHAEGTDQFIIADTPHLQRWLKQAQRSVEQELLVTCDVTKRGEALGASIVGTMLAHPKLTWFTLPVEAIASISTVRRMEDAGIGLGSLTPEQTAEDNGYFKEGNEDYAVRRTYPNEYPFLRNSYEFTVLFYPEGSPMRMRVGVNLPEEGSMESHDDAYTQAIDRAMRAASPETALAEVLDGVEGVDA